MVRIASTQDFGSDSYTITSPSMDITHRGRPPSFFDLFVSSPETPGPEMSPIPWDHPAQEPWLRALAAIAIRICPGCEPSEEKSVHDAAVYQVEAAQYECAKGSLHEKLHTIGIPTTLPALQKGMAPATYNVMPEFLVAGTASPLKRPTAVVAVAT